MDRPKLPEPFDAIRSNLAKKCMEEIECLEGTVPPAALRVIKDTVKKYLYYAVRDASRRTSLNENSSGD